MTLSVDIDERYQSVIDELAERMGTDDPGEIVTRALRLAHTVTYHEIETGGITRFCYPKYVKSHPEESILNTMPMYAPPREQLEHEETA